MENEGMEISSADVSNAGYPSDSELMSDGFQIESNDLSEPANDVQPEKATEDMEHRKVMTEQQMLDELLKNDEPKEGNKSKDDSFKIPEDFKEVLKRGDELHHVGYNELKELAQKGFDYTKKTQEVSKERETLTKEREEFNQEVSKGYEAVKAEYQKHHEKMDQFNKIEYAFDMIAEKDPDLIEQFKVYIQQAERELNNPVNKSLKSQISSLEQKLNQIESFNSNRNAIEKNEYIAKNFHSDLDKIKSSYESNFSKLGIRPDWDKVKQAWIDGEANKTTVEQAFFSIHGPLISKAYESKMKVLNVESKAGKRTSPVSRTNQPTATKRGPTSWGSIENEVYNDLKNGKLNY